MTKSEILVQLAEHRDELTAALGDLEGEAPFPAGPEIEGLELNAADYNEARQLLSDLTTLQDRVSGLQARIAGELAGMRRPRASPFKPAPRAIDTSL